jgi:hypothetical protein
MENGRNDHSPLLITAGRAQSIRVADETGLAVGVAAVGRTGVPGVAVGTSLAIKGAQGRAVFGGNAVGAQHDGQAQHGAEGVLRFARADHLANAQIFLWSTTLYSTMGYCKYSMPWG